MTREDTERFLQWCIDERESAERSANWLEQGTMQISVDGNDVSADEAKHRRRIIKEMDALIKKVTADLRGAA